MKKSLLFLILISIFIFVGLTWNTTFLFFSKEYICIAPKEISSHYFSFLNNAVKEMIAKNSTAHELINQLKKQFSILDKIVVSYLPTAIHVQMSCYEPICCINDDLILTSDNAIVSKDFFSVVLAQDLPKIAVLQEDMTNIPLLVSSLVHELPSYFNQRYNVEFINDHDVRLTDKQEPNFIIIFTVDQKKSPSLVAQCELVKKNIAERAGFDKGVKWMADTRFAHYIVAYRV